MRLSWLLLVALVHALLVPADAPRGARVRALDVLATSTTLVADEVGETTPRTRERTPRAGASDRAAPFALTRGQARPTRRPARSGPVPCPLAARALTLPEPGRTLPRGALAPRSRGAVGPDPRPPRA